MGTDSMLNLESDKNGPVEAPLNKMEFVNSWFLMSSPMTPATILIMYLLFVLSIGPKYMKHRKPYEFPTLILFYNAVQVTASAFLIYSCGRMLAINGVIPKTCTMDTEFNRQGIASAMYYYLLAKVSELLDTVFFVLRKKDRQISFLHVYHHTLMVVVTWTALKYEPTIHLLFLGVANSFVHVLMYTYYGLSSFPSMLKYLWWKKYLTGLQLVQFVIVTSIFINAAVSSECSPSYILTTVLSANMFLLLCLFGKFYLMNYTKKNTTGTKGKIINEEREFSLNAFSDGQGTETVSNGINKYEDADLRKRQNIEVQGENEFTNQTYRTKMTERA